jgi:multidrug efflux pump subunit AcrB
VRTPASSSIEYARLKMERAAEIARSIPETRETNSNITASGGRIYVDIGKRHTRSRSAKEIASELRDKVRPLVGAEYVVLDDLNNGARKPIQIDFTGPDSRKLLEITSAYMDKLRQIPGAVDVGLSQQDPKKELKIELNRGLPTPWVSRQ